MKKFWKKRNIWIAIAITAFIFVWMESVSVIFRAIALIIFCLIIFMGPLA